MTQVVRPVEGHVFHNRLTHTLEVAQVARRLAERLSRQYPELTIDPEAAEAGALAHDLGHPPFGHLAEYELNRLAIQGGATDGFEGNAQSFRIVTKLAAHRAAYRGLNLTRKSLRAILKYPWQRNEAHPKRSKKFGAYRSETAEFAFATRETKDGDRSIEAAIMDHADDITYSVHDFDDFYRAGLIPLELFDDVTQREEEFDLFKASLAQNGKLSPQIVDTHRDGLVDLIDLLPSGSRYVGRYDERCALRTTTATLINRFIGEPSIEVQEGVPQLVVGDAVKVQMRFLQNLVWRYVITSPRLATQQAGERQVITALFKYYLGEIRSSDPDRLRALPPLFQQEVEELGSASDEYLVEGWQARLAADIVASLGERQAVALFRRISGTDAGSITDLI